MGTEQGSGWEGSLSVEALGTVTAGPIGKANIPRKLAHSRAAIVIGVTDTPEINTGIHTRVWHSPGGASCAQCGKSPEGLSGGGTVCTQVGSAA